MNMNEFNTPEDDKLQPSRKPTAEDILKKHFGKHKYKQIGGVYLMDTRDVLAAIDEYEKEILDRLEAHIINFEDDWCRNPRTEFKIFEETIQKKDK